MVVRSRVMLGWLITVAAGVSIVPATPTPAQAATTEFTYTGAAQTYRVPSGVVSVVVEAWGAQGGVHDTAWCESGGFGGYTRATLTVAPGEELRVLVGGRGSTFTDPDRQQGGFNGGGDGVNDTVGGSRGGGGASDVRRAPYALEDRLVVAGGGGGGAYGAGPGDESGGAGGGPVGGDGLPAPHGGAGGTQTAGGEAGPTAPTVSLEATPGTFGQGGKGGYGGMSGAFTGGGGGGGWYGGGGAGGAAGFPGSGGGGGSSYGPPGAVLQQGVRGVSGNCDAPLHGLVRITPTPSEGTFHSLDPARLLDTRQGLGATAGIVPAGGTVELQVTGRGGVPSSGVEAVVLNLTAALPQAKGFVTGYPCGQTRPVVSNLNVEPGITVANMATIKVGAGGKVCLYSQVSTHLVADVNGYVTGPGRTTGSRYHPLDPGRLVDTRLGATLAAGDTLELVVIGQQGVPPSGVSAVVLNVTATNALRPGFVTGYPCGGERPTASNLNYRAGVTIANLTTLKVGAGGKVCLYTLRRVDLVVDVAGWYGPEGASSGALLNSVAPSRIVDTRIGVGATNQPVPAGGTIAVNAAGAGGIPADGATAAIVNMTATNVDTNGYLTAYPCTDTVPTASNLNYSAGRSVPNHVIVKLNDDGQFCVYSHRRADVVIDVNGWYGP